VPDNRSTQHPQDERRARDSLDQQRVAAFAALRASQWQSAVCELLNRLETDWPALVATMGLAPTARLDAIGEPLGDVYNGGRSAYRLTFSDGGALVYKPRTMAMEHAFARMVGWLTSNGFQPLLTACEILPRAGYGWSRIVHEMPCEGEQDLTSLFERQGAFLALFLLLGAVDCSDKNVVCHGSHPMWVDPECVCQPTIPHLANRGSQPHALADSVLTTGMILSSDPRSPGEGTALSGVRVIDRRTGATTAYTVQARDIDAFAAGFRTLYQWVLDHNEGWLANDGPVSWWTDVDVGIVLRPTGVYTALTDTMVLAEPEARSLRREQAVEVLRLSPSGEPWPDALVSIELAAIERGDVPRWFASTSSRDLRESAGSVARNIATQTGMERVQRIAARMGSADLDHQEWLIRSFLSIPSAPVGRERSVKTR
jgi:lantibiotic modifying enzyme